MIYKPYIQVAAVSLLLGAVLARMRAVFEKCVPLGYEDAGGFHPGDEPAD